MNRAQRNLVVKVVLVIMLLGMSLLFSEILSSKISKVGSHREMLIWLGITVLILVTISKSKSDIAHVPTYEERHSKFNQIMDENPWMKMFYAVYGIAVPIGVYYFISNDIEVGALGFFGTLFFAMLPIIIFKIKQAYQEAGNENE